MKNDENFLNEASRVLKHGGIFICLTPNKLSLIPEGEKAYDEPYYPFHCREYTPAQFYSLLDDYFKELKKICFYNPDREYAQRFSKNKRVKMIYRLTKFKFIRWLGRKLPLRLKQFVWFYGQKDLKPVDKEAASCEYHDKLSFIPEVLCGIYIKIN